MARVTRGTKGRQRKNKILKRAKGFSFDRRTKFKITAETVKRALHYSYIGRKLKKRDMRSLWIARISAATKLLGSNYSRFMNDLKTKNCLLNRKMLSEIAARDFDAFKKIFESVSSKS